MVNLKVGQFVTVERWLKTSDRSYVGDVLEIKAINTPFAVLVRYRPNGTSDGNLNKITLNINEVDIMPLSQDFVNAYFGKPIPTIHRWQNLIDFIKKGDFKGKEGIRFGKSADELKEIQKWLFENGYGWFASSRECMSYPSELKLKNTQNGLALCTDSFKRSDYLYYNPALCQFVEDKLVPWTREDVPPVCWLRNKKEHRNYALIINVWDNRVETQYHHWFYTELVDLNEYSTDLKTWKPCGKEAV